MNTKINLMTIWAYNKRSQGKYKGKKGMMVDAINYYKEFLGVNSLWIGDFNNGPTIRDGKFWTPVLELFNQNQMHEVQFPGPQYTHKNNKGTLHHIDHCLAGADLITHITAKERLNLDDVPSDHAPLIIDLIL